MKVLRTRFKLLRSRVYPLSRAIDLLRRKAWTCCAGELLRSRTCSSLWPYVIVLWCWSLGHVISSR